VCQPVGGEKLVSCSVGEVVCGATFDVEAEAGLKVGQYGSVLHSGHIAKLFRNHRIRPHDLPREWTVQLGIAHLGSNGGVDLCDGVHLVWYAPVGTIDTFCSHRRDWKVIEDAIGYVEHLGAVLIAVLGNALSSECVLDLNVAHFVIAAQHRDASRPEQLHREQIQCTLHRPPAPVHVVAQEEVVHAIAFGKVAPYGAFQ